MCKYVSHDFKNKSIQVFTYSLDKDNWVNPVSYTHLRIMPDAQLSDGLFQLIVVKTANPVDVLRLMAMALNGNHVNDPQIIYTKTKYLKVELLDNSKDKEPLPVNLDGEIGGHLPIDFENLKQHIEFYVG